MEDKKIEHLTRKELIKKVKMMERDEEIKKLIRDKRVIKWFLGFADPIAILVSLGILHVIDNKKGYVLSALALTVLISFMNVVGIWGINYTNKGIKKLKYADLDEDNYEYNVSYSDNDDDFITMTEETKIPKDEEGILLDYYQYQKEQKSKESQKTLDKK